MRREVNAQASALLSSVSSLREHASQISAAAETLCKLCSACRAQQQLSPAFGRAEQPVESCKQLSVPGTSTDDLR